MPRKRDTLKTAPPPAKTARTHQRGEKPPSNDDMGFRLAVRARLAEAGMTQSDLATKTGITRHNISRWLTGGMSISLANAQRVLDALGGRIVWDGQLPGQSRAKKSPDP